MAIVWRLEDKNGVGMYMNCKLNRAYELAGNFNCNDPSRHPSPMFDNKLGFDHIHPAEQDNYFFGFASLSQMKQWVYIPEVRRQLSLLGILLVKYNVPREYYRRSPFQVVFRREWATKVSSRAPDYND